MKKKEILKLSLDKFINLSLYNKKFGYYMKKNPFGKKGDFITAPNISRLFSEMIAIWILIFWQSLGSPKKFNLVDLGAGNGEMMKIFIESFKNFPLFFKSCNFIIHEKSPKLVKIQKKKLSKNKIIWTSKLKQIKKIPSIFIANEFFDAMPIRQFVKRGNLWFEKYVNLQNKKKPFFFEKYVNLQNKKKPFFFEKKININDIEKKIGLNISKNQNFIEYSPIGINYLKELSKIINENSGGLLLIDYGYTEKKMKNTLKGIKNHKFANILSNIGNADITHNISFKLFKDFIKNFNNLDINLTTQRNFLIKTGIKERAEILSRNLSFSKKADIYYRIKRLIDEREMGNLFKVMLIKNKKNKFNLGF